MHVTTIGYNEAIKECQSLNAKVCLYEESQNLQAGLLPFLWWHEHFVPIYNFVHPFQKSVYTLCVAIRCNYC